MNQKTILGLAAILALTLIIVSGFYFFSANSSVQKPVQTAAAGTSDIPASEAAASEGIPAAEVDGIDVEELTAGSKGSSSAQHVPLSTADLSGDEQANQQFCIPESAHLHHPLRNNLS